MKAASADAPPSGPEWVHEVKWDGMRVLVHVAGGATTLASGNGLDATARFPELAGVGAALGCDALLDGEVVALDDAGRTDFGLLQRRIHLSNPVEVRRVAAEVPVGLALFDLLWLDGHDLCALPWTDRRRLLEGLVEPAPAWRVPRTHDDGDELMAVAAARGLEGIVSKRRGSAYQPGRRSPAWRKVKVRRHQEVVVGGWRPGDRGREGHLGSLVVGVHDPSAPGNPLRFAGKVGTGFTGEVLAGYQSLLAGLATDTCPFTPGPPTAVARGTRWVRPEVVVEVAFAEWTAEGVLRHPSHLGRRLDKEPADVVRE